MDVCWFYDTKKEFPKLGKLKYFKEGSYVAFSTPKVGMTVQTFKFCEKFKGILPDWI